MVLVLEKPKLLYIRSIRTGTRSTTKWMVETTGIAKETGSAWHQRWPLFVKEAEEPDNPFCGRLNQYESFGFVRNPFDIMATYYVDHMQRDVKRLDTEQLEYVRASPNMRVFAERCQEVNTQYWKSEFMVCFLDGVDHILKYEDNFPQVLFDFLESKGQRIPQEWRDEFPRIGLTKGKVDYRRYYDEESIDWITEHLRPYLEKYGYNFNGPISTD